MEVNILSSGKNEMEFEVDNITIAEVLRVYLNENGADFAAWRRVHPSKPVIFRLKSSDKTVSKTVSDAVSQIKKDCEKILSVVKK